MTQSIERLIAAARRASEAPEPSPHEHEVIVVSETTSTAASAYELLRNSLEYDEEHLLRRNAIRRILKRRIDEGLSPKLASELLRELIWARYLPNRKIPEAMGRTVALVMEKYVPLFDAARVQEQRHALHNWLLDLLSTEIEYTLSPPVIEEALATYAYEALKMRMKWGGKLIGEAERDIQLYAAVHRAVLKSNAATLRFRLFTVYYAGWTKAHAEDGLVQQIAATLPRVMETIEAQISHPGADHLYRVVRRHAVVFHLLRDVCVEDPDAFETKVHDHQTDALDLEITKAAKKRYDRFRIRLRTGVLRAVAFLFLTKTLIALIVEVPYELLAFQELDNRALAVNILFHPILLAVIGMSVRLPESKNTKKILDEVHGLLGTGDDFAVVAKFKRPWSSGPLGVLFQVLYAIFFAITIGAISSILASYNFHAMSIALFVFFLMLVTFFGLKIRNTKRELIIVEAGTGVVGTVIDILFLPVMSAGRWISLRAPKVNVFLFFFDFIVEAPFKAAVGLVEGWLAYLREKKEEI